MRMGCYLPEYGDYYFVLQNHKTQAPNRTNMSKNREFWISELDRIHRRSTEAINTGELDIAESLAENFNEMLRELEDNYPDNDIVNSTKTLRSAPNSGYTGTDTHPVMLSKVRNRSERIAQSLNIDLEHAGGESGSETINEDMPRINIENTNKSEQTMTNEIDISTQIDVGPWNQEVKDELRDLWDEYDAELDTDEPDESKLRRLLEKAGEYSVPLAANMGIKALEKGVLAVLSL